ncbi:hypothetical protein TCAL_03938 [Tigriopus californicus]|uniref:Enoyl reductase (ER) domain-containing protein n=1 Tax=Tigriopus californicus TaxID=6832 RepID=A0A553P2P4_TIGCA|nr:erythritol/L-threitol dehydrogenase-like [Tigriopus californicus]TRY71951.1 hypothetical protein TCAL_03938 [Tigriopus californicus]
MADLPSTMTAVVVRGKEDYRLEQVPVPQPGPKEVLVKVLAVGICAGDAKTFDGATRFWGDGKDIPCYVEPPVIPGHEFSGEVVALGEGAAIHHGVEIGDLTVSEQIVPCHDCRYCQRGQYQMCIPHDVYGFHQVTQGAMTQYLLYPAKALVHKVPKTVDPFHACFVEPLACSLHAVELGNIQFNDIVVVSGCGPLGLGMVAGARQKSPKCLIALDMQDWKLEVAKKCGADIVLNPSKVDLQQEIKTLSEGFGCDVYIEATGHPSSVVQGLNCIARMGRFVEFSVFGKEVSADWSIISDTKELTIVGGHLGPNCWPKAIAMIAENTLPMDEIITHRFKMINFLEGIKMVLKGTDSIKIMLIPEN